MGDNVLASNFSALGTECRYFLSGEPQKKAAILEFINSSICLRDFDTRSRKWQCCIRWIMEMVTTGDTQDFRNSNVLFALACAKDIEAVRIMIRGGAQAGIACNTIFSQKEEYPLHIALNARNLDVVKALVETKAVSIGEPLSKAFDTGDHEIVKYLLGSGIDGLKNDHENFRILRDICGQNTKAAQDLLVKLILDGLNVDICLVQDGGEKGNLYSETPLLVAMRLRNTRMIATLVALCGHQLLPPVKWASGRTELLSTSSPIEVVLRFTTIGRPLREFLSLSPETSVRNLYERVQKILNVEFLEIKWQSGVLYPGGQSLREMGFKEREVVEAICNRRISPFVFKAIKSLPSLIHFPVDRKKFLPKIVKDSIVCFMLVVKRKQWPIDKNIMRKIVDYLCFGWLINYNTKQINVNEKGYKRKNEF